MVIIFTVTQNRLKYKRQPIINIYITILFVFITQYALNCPIKYRTVVMVCTTHIRRDNATTSIITF